MKSSKFLETNNDNSGQDLETGSIRCIHNKRAEYAQPLGHPKRPTSDPIPSNKIRMKPKHIFSDIDLETSAPDGIQPLNTSSENLPCWHHCCIHIHEENGTLINAASFPRPWKIRRIACTGQTRNCRDDVKPSNDERPIASHASARK